MMDYFDFGGESFVPLPSGALWSPVRNLLLVADLHLEKGSFFATTGQMLPPYDSRDTLDRLSRDIENCSATMLICLGDSFHDKAAFERLHEESRTTVQRLTRSLDWHWITGNHDPAIADDLGGRSHVELQRFGLIFRHEAQTDERLPEISGHFHPKLRLRQRGRTVSRRCFALAPHKLILPAYGAFAGGLDVDSEAIGTALGPHITAIVSTARGFSRLPIRNLARAS
jgi:uncharacterized protein